MCESQSPYPIATLFPGSNKGMVWVSIENLCGWHGVIPEDPHAYVGPRALLFVLSVGVLKHVARLIVWMRPEDLCAVQQAHKKRVSLNKQSPADNQSGSIDAARQTPTPITVAHIPTPRLPSCPLQRFRLASRFRSRGRRHCHRRHCTGQLSLAHKRLSCEQWLLGDSPSH
eukprot:scaffold2093_cov425-Prasinococcus_capsulatus_cf.AAC.10